MGWYVPLSPVVGSLHLFIQYLDSAGVEHLNLPSISFSTSDYRCGAEPCLRRSLHLTPGKMSLNSDEMASPPVARARQMLGAACEECRRRKLRCDRQRPRCSVCDESGVRCETSRSTGHRGPKKGYLKDLKSRVGMESRAKLADSQPIVSNQHLYTY